MRLERLTPEADEWARIDGHRERLVFQTREWVSFVAATQGAEPVVAAVKDGHATVGYFTGLVVRRFGIPILGSPLPGWTTQYMGFVLDEGVSRRAAVEALLPFAFGELGCMHLELRDPTIRLDTVTGLGFEHTPKISLEVDLRRREDEILASMTSACRRCIRKAEKVGVTVEEASDDACADDYYGQLQDVFAKQSLVPMYGVQRVRALIEQLHPTGRLLLLRARSPDGECIATGIFPALNRAMYFWGGASWRQHQIMRPNEAVMWYAMRYWKARGVETCDLGGGAEYKRKYGPREVEAPFLRKSRFRAVSRLRALARQAFRQRQRAMGRLGMGGSRRSG
jgi:hypothetical protein